MPEPTEGIRKTPLCKQRMQAQIFKSLHIEMQNAVHDGLQVYEAVEIFGRLLITIGIEGLAKYEGSRTLTVEEHDTIVDEIKRKIRKLTNTPANQQN